MRSAIPPLTIDADVSQKAPWKNHCRNKIGLSMKPYSTKYVPPMNLLGFAVPPKARAYPVTYQQRKPMTGTMMFFTKMFCEFLTRTEPISRKQNPALMNQTRYPVSSIQIVSRGSL